MCTSASYHRLRCVTMMHSSSQIQPSPVTNGAKVLNHYSQIKLKTQTYEERMALLSLLCTCTRTGSCQRVALSYSCIESSQTLKNQMHRPSRHASCFSALSAAIAASFVSWTLTYSTSHVGWLCVIVILTYTHKGIFRSPAQHDFLLRRRCSHYWHKSIGHTTNMPVDKYGSLGRQLVNLLYE